MKRTALITRILLALVVLLSCTAGAQAAGGKERYPARDMRSLVLELENGDFNEYERKGGSVEFRDWVAGPVPRGRSVAAEKGYNESIALTVSGQVEGEKDGAAGGLRVTNRVVVPAGWRSGKMNMSVSAWVWSDKVASTFMEVGSQGFTAASAYHPGNGGWEYLTVVFPFLNGREKDSFTVSLVSTGGISRFSAIRAVAIIDDRFDGLTDEELRFRERLTYGKGGRRRVAIVGNSTVWGTGAPRNATISYILQSKLESIYPGVFEVVNYGIGCWSLTNQIVSLKNNFVYKTWCNAEGRGLTPDNIRDNSVSSLKDESERVTEAHRVNAVTLAELEPDLILLGSLWNDVIYAMGLDGLPDDTSIVDGVPLSSLYYRALYNYMDSPTVENYALAAMAYGRVREAGEGDSSPVIKDAAGGKRFDRLKDASRLKEEFLVNEFIRRTAGVAEVAAFNLPSKDSDRAAELIEKAPWFLSRGAFLISDTSKESLKGYFGLFDTASAIDSAVLTEVSKRFGVPFLDIKKAFEDGHRELPVSLYVNLEYFHDTIHFTYRGNEWIADRIFMGLKNRFAAMARRGER